MKYFFLCLGWLCLGLLPTKVVDAQDYTILNQFGDLATCDTMTRGIYIVWWDSNWDYADDADKLLDTMLHHREICLNQLSMQDPPNPTAGHYYNVYLHNGNDVFPDGWGNGQGTDQNGFPFLTLPIGAHQDKVNVAHETFHIFQYSATSPGFAYSGDSQWYIEASANWYAAARYPEFAGTFLEAESLVRLPQVPLWLSFDNFPADYPQNWQRYVHQYALALLLFYLTEEADVPPSIITAGLYAGTDELPQEYYYNQLGGDLFRGHFMDFAARMINGFDFLSPAQVDVLENEWETYADPADDFEFVATYQDEGTNGWFRPTVEASPRTWAFNTIRLNTTEAANYSFEVNGDEVGSQGDPAHFRAMLVRRRPNEASSFETIELDPAANTGQISVTSGEAPEELFLIVASLPEIFSGVAQRFSYEVRIERTDIVSATLNYNKLNPVVEVGRFNALGQAVEPNTKGLHYILYSNGLSKAVFVY